MEETKWEKLTEAVGQVEGDVIKSYLEANDIPVRLIQEAVGKLIGSTLDAFGLVEVFVPENKLREAEQLLQESQNTDQDATGDTQN